MVFVLSFHFSFLYLFITYLLIICYIYSPIPGSVSKFKRASCIVSTFFRSWEGSGRFRTSSHEKLYHNTRHEMNNVIRQQYMFLCQVSGTDVFRKVPVSLLLDASYQPVLFYSFLSALGHNIKYLVSQKLLWESRFLFLAL